MTQEKLLLRLRIRDDKLYNFSMGLSRPEKVSMISNAIYRGLVINKVHKTMPLLGIYGEKDSKSSSGNVFQIRLGIKDPTLIAELDELDKLSSGNKMVFNAFLANLIRHELFGEQRDQISNHVETPPPPKPDPPKKEDKYVAVSRGIMGDFGVDND